MASQMVDLPEKTLVGIGGNFISILSPNRNNSVVIPRLWHQYIQRIDTIQHKIAGASYGLIEMLTSAGDNADPHELFYIACTEVSKLETLPEGMVSRIVLAGRYASFTHRGKLDHLRHTMDFIYGSWLPSSGLKRRRAAEIERYDARFNPESDASEFDILIPVTEGVAGNQ